MTKCRQCKRRAQLFLCQRCIDVLAEMLRDLPTWIGWLKDSAHGQTRLGQSARRSSDKGSPALANLGPTGDFKNSPSELLTRTHAVLLEWARDICRSRGHELRMRAYPPDFIGPLPADAIRCEYTGYTEFIALWLAQHVNAIAADKAANVCYREIDEITNDIGRMINRPLPHRDLGTCPTILTDGYGSSRECRNPLTAKRGQTEIQCDSCKATFDVEALIRQRIDDVADWLFTAREILDIMASIGEPIAASTWRRWRATGKIESRNELGSEPKYLLSEVRALRNEKQQSAACVATYRRA